MIKDSHYRSIAKAITWRITGTLDTIILSYLISGEIKVALYIGSTEVFSKIFLFYLHERIWNNMPFGRTSTGPKPYRSLVKSVSWRIMGTIDTILLAYIFTGDTRMALSIGFTEVGTKIILYYLHERIWSKIKWGRIKETPISAAVV